MLRQLLNSSKRWLNLAEALVLPPQCVCCHAGLAEPGPDDLTICSACNPVLNPAPYQACPQCAATVPLITGAPAAPGCPRCAGVRWQFDTTVALGKYEGQFRQAVLRLKMPMDEPLAMTLGRLLAHRHAATLRRWQPDLIAPIPMHWLRRLRRSVNNPETIAAELSRELGVPWRRRLLRRRRMTTPHGQLSHAQRRDNVRGAFQLTWRTTVAGRRILLVDDILTTGSTCNEAAKVLRQAGAAAVAVAVIARADGPS